MMRMLNEPIASALHVPQPPAPKIRMGKDRRELDPTGGFAHFGEFAYHVRRASVPGPHLLDPRLEPEAATPTTSGNEASGVDGGFLLPVQFADEVFTYAQLDDPLLSLADVVTISSNSMILPVDENTPWGTDGMRAYWQAEGTLGVQTKPKIRDAVMRLHKLIALCPMSDEIVEDAAALNAWLPRRLGLAITWATNEAIIRGTGAGEPLGCLTGPAAIIVAKESGQATLTLNVQNLGRMLTRLPQGSYNRAVFLIHSDALLYLIALGPQLVSLDEPPPNHPGSPVGSICGRPFIVSQHCSAFTSQGDVLLLDLSWYAAIVKSLIPRIDLSMHLYFDADASAFRATFRIDGQPKLSAAIAPAPGGTNTLSPFLQLGAR
ncbi:MAG: phage major capsid protein [Pseudomonadota bacterium]|nr:phage major capsid protein [Pseudomonadota bacterium]